MSVRLWPTLPKDHELNGLVALERPLLDDPAGPFYFIAEVNRRRATIDDDDDATTPTIRVLHGEALLGELSGEARDLLKRAQAARLPRPKPPEPTLFDGEDDRAPLPGGGGADPVQRHIDRAAALAEDMEPELDDGDDADGGAPVSPRHLTAVPE